MNRWSDQWTSSLNGSLTASVFKTAVSSSTIYDTALCKFSLILDMVLLSMQINCHKSLKDPALQSFYSDQY
jgi:hypothetical protein